MQATLTGMQNLSPVDWRAKRVFSLAIALVLTMGAEAAITVDEDGDGVLDHEDNCLFAANTDQSDADGDGIGNICDADLNNDCMVNAVDLGLFKVVYQTANETADFNGDGLVDDDDLDILRSGFFRLPGPSGFMTACACRPPVESLSLGNGGFDDTGIFLLSGLPGGSLPIAGTNNFTRQAGGRYVARVFVEQAGDYDFEIADKAGDYQYCSDVSLAPWTSTELDLGSCELASATFQAATPGCYQFTVNTGLDEFPDRLEVSLQERLVSWSVPIDAGEHTVMLPNGVELDFPEGSVTEPLELIVGELPCAEVSEWNSGLTLNSHDIRCIGGITAEPDGLVFNEPVGIRLPVELLQPGEVPVLMSSELGNNTYSVLPTEVTYRRDEGVFTASITGFSDKAAGGVVQSLQTAPPLDTLPDCFYEENPPPGNCCAVYSSISSAGDTTGTDCDCELIGSNIRTEFPLCPGSPVFTDEMTFDSGNCPQDLAAIISPSSANIWSCEQENFEIILTGTKKDGESCSMLLPVMWSLADTGVATVAETGPNAARVTGGDAGGATQLKAESLVGTDFSLAVPISVTPIDGEWQVQESGTQTCHVAGVPGTWEESDSMAGTMTMDTLGCSLVSASIPYPGASDSSGPLTVTGKDNPPIEFTMDLDEPQNSLGCVILRESNGKDVDFGEAPCDDDGPVCTILSCSETIRTTGSLGPVELRKGSAASTWHFTASWAQSGDTYSMTCDGGSTAQLEKN